MPNLDDISKVLAYQKSNLLHIQHLYDTLRLDLADLLAQEHRIREEIPTLIEGLVELTEAIESGQEGGASSPLPWWEGQGEGERSKPYTRIDTYRPKNPEDLIKKAETYLQKHGIDPGQDPLIQVLSSQEIIDISESYRKKYGQIRWDREDYIVVTLAGCVGALMDMFLVKIPGNPKLLLTLPQGYVLTKWIRKNSSRIREEYLEPIKALAKPRSDQKDEECDSLLEFIFAVLDIVRCTGTYVDEHGDIVISQRLSEAAEEARTIAFTKILLRLFSDVFASVGMEPPFGSLLEDKDISWKNVYTYLHVNGYTIRSLLMMGIIPATIELIVKGYWLLKNFDQQENLGRTRVKITSMLLLSHTLALSGNFVKTGVIFQINPLALNWDQIARFFPLMIAWINEGIERENTIRATLDEEWVKMYKGMG